MLVALVFCSTFFITNSDAQDDDGARAGKVKAVFLYNFIKFVEWPEGRSPVSSHKVDICIMGENSFGSSLDVLKSGLSGKMDVNILSDVSPSAAGNCHVLFISRGADADIGSVLATARKKSVLTVSEMEAFADKGGIIEMKTVQKSVGLFSSNKINLRINVKAAEAAQLRINAQLLEIAAEVIK